MARGVPASKLVFSSSSESASCIQLIDHKWCTAQTMDCNIWLAFIRLVTKPRLSEQSAVCTRTQTCILSNRRNTFLTTTFAWRRSAGTMNIIKQLVVYTLIERNSRGHFSHRSHLNLYIIMQPMFNINIFGLKLIFNDND